MVKKGGPAKRPSSSAKPRGKAAKAEAGKDKRQQYNQQQDQEEQGEATSIKDAKKRKQQQALLNVFSSALSPVLTGSGGGGSSEKEKDEENVLQFDEARFTTLLQEVKQALYKRDFAAAFGREDYLQVYAARWSPTRALCYSRVLADIRHHVVEAGILPVSSSASPSPSSSSSLRQQQRHLRALCIGGGAAEVVAFGDFLRLLREEEEQEGKEKNVTTHTTTTTSSTIHLLDTAPWGPVINRLSHALVTPPTLSKYASASARATNRAVIPSSSPPPPSSPSTSPPSASFSTPFTQADVLNLSESELSDAIKLLYPPSPSSSSSSSLQPQQQSPPPPPMLITLLFTLNELYNTGDGNGISRTTSFLRRLSLLTPPGSLLLVVDSPGSYSEAEVTSSRGKEGEREEGEEKDKTKTKKKYPMHWLLEHTLLPPPPRRRTEEEKNKKEKETETETEKTTTVTSLSSSSWEKLESQDSIWFRLEPLLRYPIPLEDMRYQMHLYRKKKKTTTTGEGGEGSTSFSADE